MKAHVRNAIAAAVATLASLQCSDCRAGLLSFQGTGGFDFKGLSNVERYDVVEWDPVTDTASFFIDGGAEFPDIDALDVLSNGHVLFSYAGSGGFDFKGLQGVANNDIVEWDPISDTASFFVRGGADFPDIDAFSVNPVPEPSSFDLLGMGGLTLLGCGLRRQRRQPSA